MIHSKIHTPRYTPSLDINTILQAIIRVGALFALLFSVIGCAKEDMRLPNPIDPDLIEGEKTTLLLGLATPDIKVHTRAELGDEKEKEIISLAVFIFDGATGKVVSSTFHATVGAHVVGADGKPIVNVSGDTTKVLSPTGQNYIPIETLTGNNRNIYVIANYDANVIENLKAISTEDQLKESIFQVVANPLFREFGMMKVGQLEKEKIRKNIPLKIDMDYVSAKITLKVTNHYSSGDPADYLTIDGWTLGNIPAKGYVVERDMIPNEPNLHDAADIYSDNDYYNDFTNQNFDFESVSPDKKDYSSTFYMVENRRGGRAQRAAPPGAARDEEYLLKAWYAPARASYARVYATLTKGGVKERLIITHYLGEDNEKDYNVWRGKHYTYHITINTLGKIHIDTNVESNKAQLKIDIPVDPMSLDAHYGFRMIRIYSNEITDPNYSVNVEVLQAVNSELAPQWLDLAITPITMHHVKVDPNSYIGKWQQDGGAIGSYVRPKFVPNKAVRDSLKKGGTPYKLPTTNAEIIGDTDSNFPDNDRELPFDKAIHRMCKRITDLASGVPPYSLTSPLNIMLYAEEYPFDNSPTALAYREAVVRVTLLKNNIPEEYQHFTVRQYPPLRYMQIPGQNTVMLVERTEEYEHMLQPTLPLDRQMLAGVQWGPWNIGATEHVKGDANTLLGVYLGAGRSAGEYQTMYGSEGGGWKYSPTAEILPYTGTTLGAPFYNMPDITDNNHVNVIYNTTAARYCHEKNWDKNGNGNIDPEETFWYLPSTLEMQQFWTLHELLDLRPDYYWSSTQADESTAYAFSMLSSPADAHRVFNGVPQRLNKTGLHNVNRPRVRCTRRSEAAKSVTPIAPMVMQKSNKAVVVDCSNLPGSIYTTESKLGITQGNVGGTQLANEKIYKKLEVDSMQYDATNYYDLHIGNGKCNSMQGWRLPTQREMLLIWSVRDKLQAVYPWNAASKIGFRPFFDEKYWTMTRDLSARYLIDFATGLSNYETFQGLALAHRYRCVREIP